MRKCAFHAGTSASGELLPGQKSNNQENTMYSLSRMIAGIALTTMALHAIPASAQDS
jgi:hypothetical protein